jgi:hypothetical protein
MWRVVDGVKWRPRGYVSKRYCRRKRTQVALCFGSGLRIEGPSEILNGFQDGALIAKKDVIFGWLDIWIVTVRRTFDVNAKERFSNGR